MKIVICDSDEADRNHMASYLKKKIRIDTNNVTIVSRTPDEIMFDIDEGGFDYDVFITDILFKKVRYSGVDLAKKINAEVPECRVIYYTRNVPDSVDIYETRHVNCMRKGVHDERLVCCIYEIYKHLSGAPLNHVLQIRFDRTVSRVECSSVRFIRIENRVTKYYTNDGLLYEYKPLSDILEELPDNFVRCHNAIIVNMDYVKSYNHSAITMDDGEKLKIGRSYGKRFSKNFGYEERNRL